jgi:hypothetical protein
MSKSSGGGRFYWATRNGRERSQGAQRKEKRKVLLKNNLLIRAARRSYFQFGGVDSRRLRSLRSFAAMVF